MSGTGAGEIPIPLQLDLEYVDAAHDACFAWLREKYASLTAVTATASAPHVITSNTPALEKSGEDEVRKKPTLRTADLQSIENDLLACDALRWRVFAFPSHPTRPLDSSYRHEPGKKDEPASLTAELHKKKTNIKKAKKDGAAETINTSVDGGEDSGDAGESRYALFIRTRANAEAKKREKKGRQAASAAATASSGSSSPAAASRVKSTPQPAMKLEALLEKVVKEEDEARWCRILGEERVPSPAPPVKDSSAPSAQPSASTWSQWWFPRTWRPLLGGYVSAPTRKDSARLLLFPQAHHPSVDVRDATVAAASLSSPQPVPWYLRGSVSWDVEKHNPAADTPTTEVASLQLPPRSAGLSYSLQAAQTRHAPVDSSHREVDRTATKATRHPHNWADTVEVSVAVQQSRTERKYAPAREKVQRVTLLEDAAAVKVSQGDPRYSRSLSLAHITVPSSGVKRQHEAPAGGVSSVSAGTKQHRHHRRSRSPASQAARDDSIQHLQLQDAYDSTVQYFPLPRFWQRLVQPSQRSSSSPTSSSTATCNAEAERGVGTSAFKNVPRGQYRVRWSGGPGLELCTTDASVAAAVAQQTAWWTVFGKLWTESWVEVPLPWRLALKLRTQSAITMPLEPFAPLALPMVPGTPTDLQPTDTAAAAGGHASGWFTEHPYFWATQGPRWDAALVRGFKNDYSGMHHARRWYSVLSAELTLNGAGGRTGGKHNKGSGPAARADGPTAPTEEDEKAQASAGPAGRWSNTSLTAFANACVVDTLRDYPRASVGFSLSSKIPRLAITPFNEMIPHTFECSFSWFAAFKAGSTGDGARGAASGFSVAFRSGLEQQQQQQQQSSAASLSGDGAPFLRVSPVETFQHMKCGLTWRFDE